MQKLSEWLRVADTVEAFQLLYTSFLSASTRFNENFLLFFFAEKVFPRVLIVSGCCESPVYPPHV